MGYKERVKKEGPEGEIEGHEEEQDFFDGVLSELETKDISIADLAKSIADILHRLDKLETTMTSIVRFHNGQF